MLKKRENESGYFLNRNFFTRVSVKRGVGVGAGPGVYRFFVCLFFFLNAVLRLGLGLASTLTLTLTVKQIALQMARSSRGLVSFAAVIRVVTRHSSRNAPPH